MSLDVNRAQDDANAILTELRGFCDNPALPSLDSLRLCPLAKEIPNCEGFAKQCAKLLEPPRVERSPWLEAIGRAIAAIAPYIGWTILALSILTVLYLIGTVLWRSLQKDDEPDQTDDAPAEVTVTEAPVAPQIEAGTPEAILARAEAALSRGDLRAALFGFLHASLRALDVRGAIRIARDRTNGEYLRTLNDEGARPHLRAIVYEVDVVQFGGREPQVDRVRDVAQRAATLVRAASVAVLIVLALSLSGCKKVAPLRATDPAGFDVVPELLKRQGFKLTSPDKPLARLEAPTGVEVTPLLLDTNRVPLDTDAVAGLERWVKGGGTLVLFGAPWDWPTAFKATRVDTKSKTISVQPAVPRVECDEPTEECEERATQALQRADVAPQRGHLAAPAAFAWKEKTGRPIALHEADGTTYAAFGDFGSGLVLGVASNDLLTNAGIARPGNPAALMAILSQLDAHELSIVDERGGITPVSDPLSALIKAGLGIPLGHTLAFVILLALALGARYRAARDAPAEKRRAFAEHVEATGALYAHANAAPHALAAYGKFVVERIRTRLSKGQDLASTLAQRADVPREEVERLLDRATNIKAGDAPRGDELATLRALTEIYARSADPMNPTSKPKNLFRRR